MQVNHFPFFLFFFLFVAIYAAADEHPGRVDPDLQIVRDRVIAELLKPAIDETQIKTLMNSIREDGSWPDIDYEDVSSTGFEHRRHMANMLELSRAYTKGPDLRVGMLSGNKPESRYYRNPAIKRVIASSLDFWLTHDFRCKNWWWNQIGTPERIVSILLIMDDELTQTQKAKAEPIVGRANLDARPEHEHYWGARPGGDLIKIAGILGKYGLRMFSSRNHSMEQPHIGEGLKNHHFADGSNFISRTGEEYTDIFPVYDWQKIPGTTVLQKPSLPAEDEIQKQGLTEFVGAVSDGKYGAATFDFKSPLDSLEARKAWFLFDKEFVCLGSAIHSNAAYPVVTTLDQCLLKQDVIVVQSDNPPAVRLKNGAHYLTDVTWVFHDRIAYLFPFPTDVHLSNKQAIGNWRSINRQSRYTSEEVREEVFALWLDHGNKPQHATYEYIVIPGIDAAQIEDYRKKSEIKILVIHLRCMR